MTNATTVYKGHVFSIDKASHSYKCEMCKIDIGRCGELCTAQDPPKPPARPQPGSQEWLAAHHAETMRIQTAHFAGTDPFPTGVVGALIVSVRDAPAHCAHPNVKVRVIAPDVAWCYACGSVARTDPVTGVFWTRPQARSAKEIESMREALRAVHSDLGDASQSVFDLFESLKEKEAEITRQIAEHRSVVGKLTDTIENLKRDLEIAKNAL